MTALPRAMCPWCGREVAVRRNGELREHRSVSSESAPLCEGSGLHPDDLDAPIGWVPIEEISTGEYL